MARWRAAVCANDERVRQKITSAAAMASATARRRFGAVDRRRLDRGVPHVRGDFGRRFGHIGSHAARGRVAEHQRRFRVLQPRTFPHQYGRPGAIHRRCV